MNILEACLGEISDLRKLALNLNFSLALKNLLEKITVDQQKLPLFSLSSYV